MPSSGGSRSRPSGFSPVGSVGSVLVYSWQPVRELTGTDGARHAGMSQRLLQVVRSSCRLQLQVYYISGQAEPPAAAGLSSSRRRGHIFVEGCRVTHFQGNTEAQVSLHPQHPARCSTRPAAPGPLQARPAQALLLTVMTCDRSTRTLWRTWARSVRRSLSSASSSTRAPGSLSSNG